MVQNFKWCCIKNKSKDHKKTGQVKEIFFILLPAYSTAGQG